MSRLADLSERIDSRDARIGIMGLGYVGLPLAVELGAAGFRVTGFEVDKAKVRAIGEGRSYIGD
ncbi:MAG: NAD(P)-binding domain-containing protein, partial [Myxococcota bacterium]